MMRFFLLMSVVGVSFLSAQAQVSVDTVFTWQSYTRPGQCRVRIFATPPDDARGHTVVVQELAENRGPSTVSDARHLVDLIGRAFDLDPAEAYWIFHWGSFSYPGAAPDARKELLLRATFRRTARHRLSTPTWRIVSREDVEVYTDRLFR